MICQKQFYHNIIVINIVVEYGSLPQHWLLFDRIVQQITLQTDAGADNDVSPININVKDIIQL